MSFESPGLFLHILLACLLIIRYQQKVF